MRLEDYDQGPRYQAIVLDSRRLTALESPEEIREIELKVYNQQINYAPGQTIGVIYDAESYYDHDTHLPIGHKHHFRLYTIADMSDKSDEDGTVFKICVKRCNYIDEYSGELYDGIASNYLCDLSAGDQVTINGPFGLAFDIPPDKNANLLMIGMGTGIAPFRAFIKHIYHDIGDWQGKVRLFYGARSGLEMLYMNDEANDLTMYYDHATFEAIQALSPRPDWAEPAALGDALKDRAAEILSLLDSEHLYIYVAGREDILHTLETTFENISGSKERWHQIKADLQESGRWRELIY